MSATLLFTLAPLSHSSFSIYNISPLFHLLSLAPFRFHFLTTFSSPFSLSTFSIQFLFHFLTSLSTLSSLSIFSLHFSSLSHSTFSLHFLSPLSHFAFSFNFFFPLYYSSFSLHFLSLFFCSIFLSIFFSNLFFIAFPFYFLSSLFSFSADSLSFITCLHFLPLLSVYFFNSFLFRLIYLKA